MLSVVLLIFAFYRVLLRVDEPQHAENIVEEVLVACPQEIALAKCCSKVGRSQHVTGAFASRPSSICIAEFPANFSVRHGATGTVGCSITVAGELCWAHSL